MLILSPYQPLKGRPMFVQKDGWRVWLYIHDHWYLDQRKMLLGELKKWHPDRCKRPTANTYTRHLIKCLREFERKEGEWYKQMKLDPPKRRYETRH